MATRAETVAEILEAIPGSAARKMFGEYGLYLDGRIIALICDDSLYLKDLPAAAALLPDAERAPPYTGARPHLVADPWLDAPEVLAAAAWALVAVLPPPKPKAPKKPKGPAK